MHTYSYHQRWLRTMVPTGKRILLIAPEAAEPLFAALQPAQGSMLLATAALLTQLPEQTTFDTIITQADFLTQTEHPLSNIALLERLFHAQTRWICLRRRTIASIARRTRMPHSGNLSQTAYHALIAAGGYELCMTSYGPFITHQNGLATMSNGIIAATPGLRILSQEMAYIIRQQPRRNIPTEPSVSIIMPCRNEAGSVAQAIARMPRLAPHTELIAIEGNSTDDTRQALYKAATTRTDITIHVMVQSGSGKQNAVVEAAAQARGDIIIIFDGDMTLAPEDLVHFYRPLKEGRADCTNGSRLLLPMRPGAMRWPNWCANILIARLMSWPLGQRVTDTLCGTKAVWRTDYEESLRAPVSFWKLDPFGDFAFLLSCSAQSGKILDIPTTYYSRIYGRPLQGSFRYGLRLWRIGIYALIIRFFRPNP